MKTPPKDLKGKWALVTGASSGIGEQFAMELGYLQMNVIIVSNQPDGLKKVAEDVEYECGVTVHTLDIDLGSHDAVGRIMDFLDANSIEVTFLINNAGIFNFCPVSVFLFDCFVLFSGNKYGFHIIIGGVCILKRHV